MATAYLSLGSNLGDRLRLIQEAVAALTVEAGPVTALSSLYETEPWGFSSPHRFLNVALALETTLSPETLLAVTQRIERDLGRTHKSVDGRYADRTIDIDMLFYDDIVLNTPRLAIPHPHMCGRAFVLAPLCEIAPAMVHPVNGMTVAQMLAALQNNSTAGGVKP